MISSAVYILIIALMVIAAAIFSGAETGIYQLSRIRLRLGIESRRFSFVTLGRIMRDSPGLLIAILIGNNLSHYIITSIITLLLLGKVAGEHTVELLATLITVPVLFVFSELIPKNIFYYRADRLMPYVAVPLYIFKKLFTLCGLIPLLRFISGLFARLTTANRIPKTAISPARRSHIKAILQESREEDFLSLTQLDLISRLTTISHLNLSSVMTPIAKVQMASADCDRQQLIGILEKSPFTRLPAYGSSRTDIIGFINIYDCLTSADFSDLSDFTEPIRTLGGDTTVSEAIGIMQTENKKIILVTRTGPVHRHRPIGIVTMKDLAEELLGELTEW